MSMVMSISLSMNTCTRTRIRIRASSQEFPLPSQRLRDGHVVPEPDTHRCLAASHAAVILSAAARRIFAHSFFTSIKNSLFANASSGDSGCAAGRDTQKGPVSN